MKVAQSRIPSFSSVVSKMLACSCCVLLLLLWCCHASPLRGAHLERPRRSTPRMLMMETPEPSNPPTEPPTPSPTKEPTAFPSREPSLSPSTSMPSSSPPFAEPSTMEPMPTYTAPTIAAPVTIQEPSSEPSTAPTEAPTRTAAPSGTPRYLVPLADFGIEFIANNSTHDEESMQTTTEEYLLQSMASQYDTLSSIELTSTTTTSRRRRNLQESMVTQYSGNAVFGKTPVPAVNDVQQSQTVALQDTESLQAAYDMSPGGVAVVVQQVVVQPPDNPDRGGDSSSINAGLIAGLSVAAVVIVALAIFAGYKWYKNRDHVVVDLNDSKASTPPRGDFVKYSPNDFEPEATMSSPRSPNESVDESTDQSIEVSVDFDEEFSLSAASADSSVKKDPEQRRQSLLQKLALYRKTEIQPQEAIMPTALFVPQVVTRDASEVTMQSAMSSANARVTEESRAVSLLDQSNSLYNSYDGTSTDEEEEADEEDEEDILPPPVPVSTGNASQWALDTTGRELVPSDHGSRSQWSLSPTPQAGEDVDNVETQLVPAAHDFPSTTWAHPYPMIQGSQTRSYSDGPSDEMNAVMEQDLANFQLAVVSPDQSPNETPVRRTRSGHEDMPHAPPPQQYKQYQLPSQSHRARSRERRSSKPPPRTDASPQQDVPSEVTPTRSSTRSRGGLELNEVAPPPNAQRRRPRSSSSRRCKTNDDDGNGSYDGSYASNGSEVIDDLNGLSNFLRERREAQRAQRRENASQQRISRSRR